MSSAIEFLLGAPCADRRDAIVAWVVEGAAAPAAAASADHVRRCPACRAFCESLRTQRVLVRRLAEQQEAEKRRRETEHRRVRAEFSDWVDQELKVRSEREVALAMWRCGAALLRLDPNVAREFFTESRTGMVEDNSIGRLVADALSSFATSDSSSGINTTTSARAQVSLIELQRVLSRSDVLDLTTRFETIRVLADSAERMSATTRGPARSLRANLEWFHGNESLVPGFLHRALEGATDSTQRAHAIANLAVWKSSQGSLDIAVEWGREAIRINESFASPRVNLAVWTTVLGNPRSADRYFAEVATIVGRDIFRNHWPWAVVFEWLTQCLLLTNATPRDQGRSINSMWVAYHRWNGLPKSRSFNQTISRSESSS